jgi:hypothetical protein
MTLISAHPGPGRKLVTLTEVSTDLQARPAKPLRRIEDKSLQPWCSRNLGAGEGT